MDRAQLKELSKSQLKGNWKVPVLFMLIYFGLSLLISFVGSESNVGSLISFLITLAFQVWAFVALPSFFLKFSKNPQNSSFNDALVSKNVLIKSLGFILLMTFVGIIIGLIMGFSILFSSVNLIFNPYSITAPSWVVIILSIAFIVIFIAISLAISLIPYILVDKEYVGLLESIGLSIKMMKGHKWELFVLELSFLGWIILSVLTLGIGYLWLVPYMSLTMTNFYKNLDNKSFI